MAWAFCRTLNAHNLYSKSRAKFESKRSLVKRTTESFSRIKTHRTLTWRLKTNCECQAGRNVLFVWSVDSVHGTISNYWNLERLFTLKYNLFVILTTVLLLTITFTLLIYLPLIVFSLYNCELCLTCLYFGISL